MSNISLEDIASLCKRRGFIFQGSEIYGGLAGTWDYGPLGTQLKRNIEQAWWKMFVEDRADMYGLDSAILMNQKVWQASGHVDTFTDPMVEDLKTHKRFRADHLLKEQGLVVDGLSIEGMKNLIREKKILSPDGNELSEPERFNMMFKTVVGPKYTSFDRKKSGGLKAHVEFLNGVEKSEVVFDLNDEFSELGGFMFYDTQSKSYLRPETAQGIFTNYKNVVDSFYPDMPFGLAQQGKAFRNEISPRDFVFRSREFEQMEIEYFVHPDQWEEAFEQWRQKVHEWLALLGLPAGKVHELEVPTEDLAHYSKRTIDFEFDYPHGRDEILGLAYRTSFDLDNIQRATGKSMEYRPKNGGAPFVPHVIEPSFGVERALMAVLVSAYTIDELNGEPRTVLKLPKHLAPVKAAVSPLLKNKPELVAKAQEVYQNLQKELGFVTWDDNSNVGKRYRRSDEIGVPAHITIDFQTLEDDTVTVRDRDTAEQTRVKIADLLPALR